MSMRSSPSATRVPRHLGRGARAPLQLLLWAASTAAIADPAPTPGAAPVHASATLEIPNVPRELLAPPSPPAPAASVPARPAPAHINKLTVPFDPAPLQPIALLRAPGGHLEIPFRDDLTPTVDCAPLHVCDIELQAGERVQGSPFVGDTGRWKVSPAVSGGEGQRVTHLIIRPLEPGFETNLLVPTDRRTYHLRLVSSLTHYVASAAFNYPPEPQFDPKPGVHTVADSGATLPTVAVSQLNFRYRIKVLEGRPTLKPVRAMDDGHRTYISMNREIPDGQAPVLVSISARGSQQLVNYQLQGNTYVADGTFSKLALLTSAGHETQWIELTRDPCKRRGWLGICWDRSE
jgi:P-type conjugative transfer protein TrbG